jgi:hypothetical protein
LSRSRECSRLLGTTSMHVCEKPNGRKQSNGKEKEKELEVCKVLLPSTPTPQNNKKGKNNIAIFSEIWFVLFPFFLYFFLVPLFFLLTSVPLPCLHTAREFSISILLPMTTKGKLAGSLGPACIRNSSRQLFMLSKVFATFTSNTILYNKKN